MPLLLSVLVQTVLCGLLLLLHLLVTVVPEAQERHETTIGVLGIVTLIAVVVSTMLVIAFTTDREHPVFKSLPALLASLLPVTAFMGILVFGILFG